MGLFRRKDYKAEIAINNQSDRIADLGWTAFRTSKNPEKQIVIDYMMQYGIELVKSSSGLYYISHLNSDCFEDFQRMTNYRAKIASVGVVGVKFDNGTVKSTFTSLDEAYQGLKLLYDIVRNTPGEDDF